MLTRTSRQITKSVMEIIDVLVVDDDCDMRTMLRQYLEAEGVTVTCLKSGEEALAEMQVHAYRLMLTDYNMPGMDGLGLAERVSAVAPKMPMAMMTGDISGRFPQLALDAGFVAVLNKPFKPAELIQVVRMFC